MVRTHRQGVASGGRWETGVNMAGEFNDKDVPVYCVLAHKNLDSIQRMLAETNSEIKNLSSQLISAEGYIPRIHERLSLVESSAERAHSRLDLHRNELESTKKTHNSLAVKVASIAAILSWVGYFLIGKFS